MIYPSVATLEQLIWSYLNQQADITAIADVTEIHPQEHNDLADGRGRVVVSYVTDLVEGSIVSRSYLEPQIQFACWDLSYFQARRLQELVVEALEKVSGQLALNNQYTMSPVREKSTGPDFDTAAALYFTSVVYRFPINQTPA